VGSVARGERKGGGDGTRPLDLWATAVRCPGCGGLVFLPAGSKVCLGCIAKRAPRHRAICHEPGPRIALELPGDPDTQRRYREARASAKARRRLGILTDIEVAQGMKPFWAGEKPAGLWDKIISQGRDVAEPAVTDNGNSDAGSTDRGDGEDHRPDG